MMTEKALVTSEGLKRIKLSDAEEQYEKQKVIDRDNYKPEKLKDGIRGEREALLEEADIEIFKLEDNGGDTSAWRKYRQELRDITKQADLENVIWPSKP